MIKSNISVILMHKSFDETENNTLLLLQTLKGIVWGNMLISFLAESSMRNLTNTLCNAIYETKASRR